MHANVSSASHRWFVSRSLSQPLPYNIKGTGSRGEGEVWRNAKDT